MSCNNPKPTRSIIDQHVLIEMLFFHRYLKMIGKKQHISHVYIGNTCRGETTKHCKKHISLFTRHFYIKSMDQLSTENRYSKPNKLSEMQELPWGFAPWAPTRAPPWIHKGALAAPLTPGWFFLFFPQIPVGSSDFYIDLYMKALFYIFHEDSELLLGHNCYRDLDQWDR